MKKAIKLTPIAIGLVIVFLIGLVVFKPLQNVMIRAEDVKPVDVNISEITDSSAKILWTTGRDIQGVVEYGLSPTDLNYFAPETAKVSSHSVDLTLLVPGNTYYFQIRIGDRQYDNSGVPWTFSTKGPGDSADVSKPSQQSKPTPISSIDTSDMSDSSSLTCDETDCLSIKAKLGKGCTTSDYIKAKCLK